MRFDAIRIKCFGRLRDFTTDLSAGQESELPPIVVVLGPNESGKSTFSLFLTTLLYGFRPATREKHPYRPWDGGSPEGWAKLTMDNGTVMEVTRRLLSTAKGTLSLDGQLVELKNQPLDGVAHVPRTIFDQVYAVSLAELTAFRGEGQTLLDDHTLLEDRLGSLGTRDLVSPRQIAKELKADGRKYWKNDKRGRPSIAQTLRAQVQDLNEKWREAVGRDTDLRDKTKALDEANDDLHTLQSELDKARTRRDELRKIQSLRAAAEARNEGVREEEQSVREAEKRCIEHAKTFEADFNNVPEDTLDLLLTDDFHNKLDMYNSFRDEHRNIKSEPGRRGRVRRIVDWLIALIRRMFDFLCRRHTATRQERGTSVTVTQQEIIDALSGFSAEDALLRCGADLVRTVKRMAELVVDLRKRLRVLDEKRRRLNKMHTRIERLAADVGVGRTDPASLRNALEEGRRHEERLGEKAKGKERNIGQLNGDIKYLANRESVDDIEGQREVLRAKIRDAREARDRAFVLARIVEQADLNFRNQHQPTLLRFAGVHLSHMTGGRYDRIDVGDAGTHALSLSGPSIRAPGNLEGTLSRGTKEQAYLALRLAILDHLDEGNERLPLILDEALVNWDGQRRTYAFRLLERISKKRQVILFTVHEMMAAELEALGARVIVLENDSG